MPAIYDAIRAKNLAAVRELLATDRSVVSSQDELGWTPLHLVAAQGQDTLPLHEDLARLLLDTGADVHAEC